MQFPEEIQEFLQQPHFMVLGTLRHDNTIQMSVVWYEFVNNTFRVSTTTERAKYTNILRNPHVTFVIVNKDNSYQYIQVTGIATISTEGAHIVIDNLSQRYIGKKPYPADPEHKEDRVIITITPEKYTAMGFA